MITEQVKRLQVALREQGFKRGEWKVSAERKRKTDRSNGSRYTEFGPAVAVTSVPKGAANYRKASDDIVARAMEARFAFLEAGLNVTVFESDDKVSFLLLSEPRYRETPAIYRKAHRDGSYVEKRGVEVSA